MRRGGGRRARADMRSCERCSKADFRVLYILPVFRPSDILQTIYVRLRLAQECNGPTLYEIPIELSSLMDLSLTMGLLLD